MPHQTERTAPFGAPDPWSLVAVIPLVAGAVLAVGMSAPRGAVALGCAAVVLVAVDSWANRPTRPATPATRRDTARAGHHTAGRAPRGRERPTRVAGPPQRGVGRRGQAPVSIR